MRKIALFLFTFCVVAVSCDKNVKQPVEYTITNDAQQSGVYDIYITDNGTFDMPVFVKFLSGYSEDAVTITISGMPAGVTVSPTTFSAIPSYTEHFTVNTTNASLGNTQLTITASAPDEVAKTFTFNIHVVPADCSSYFSGKLTGINACSANYSYAATGSISDTSNTLTINNFGGYGLTVNARMTLDCVNRTVTIPLQTVGNGTTLSGSGSFTLDTMTISYTAISTPTGHVDNCVVKFAK